MLFMARNILTILALLFSLAACGSSAHEHKAVQPAPANNALQPNTFQATLPAKVINVIDGSTFEVLLDGKSETVSLIGVHPPTPGHPSRAYRINGEEAAGYTKSVLDGKDILIEKGAVERDEHGWLLAYVWLQQPINNLEEEIRAKMFNARMVIDGYAQVEADKLHATYGDVFIKLQGEAKEGKKGMWST